MQYNDSIVIAWELLNLKLHNMFPTSSQNFKDIFNPPFFIDGVQNILGSLAPREGSYQKNVVFLLKH